SAEDYETAYDHEVKGDPNALKPESNATKLRGALGLDSRSTALFKLENAGHVSDDAYARAMHTAIWPATGDYFLRTFIAGVVPREEFPRVGKHFVNFVRGSGPLPSIRA